MTRRTVDYVLTELKSLDLSSYPIDRATRLLSELKGNAILVTVLQPGNEIYRMRRKFGYRNKDDFSYKDEKDCKWAQRASLRGETAFYGIIGENNKTQTPSAEYVGLCECSNLLWDTNIEKGVEENSVGRWLVTKPLRLVSMVHPTVYKDIDNPWLVAIKREYNKYRFNDGFDTIQKFFCDEFSKPVNREQDYNYLISALFTKRMVSEYGFDGIVYPSQRCGGKVGLNIALSKPAVDNKKIDLVKIYEVRCFKYKGKMQCINERYIDYPSMNEHVVKIDNNEVWEELKNNQ